MRRRLRQQRQVREALLLDLGALVFELHRHGRRAPELLQAKAAELSTVDAEVRALADALEDETSMLELVASGISGSCTNCGTLLSTDARYCPACGAAVVPELARERADEALHGAPEAPAEEAPGEITTELPMPAEGPEHGPAPAHDPDLELHTEDMPRLRMEGRDEPEPVPEADAEHKPEPEPEPEAEAEPEPEPVPEAEPEPKPEPDPRRPGALPPLAEFPPGPDKPSGVLGRLRRRGRG
jgi:hypothetical protein